MDRACQPLEGRRPKGGWHVFYGVFVIHNAFTGGAQMSGASAACSMPVVENQPPDG